MYTEIHLDLRIIKNEIILEYGKYSLKYFVHPTYCMNINNNVQMVKMAVIKIFTFSYIFAFCERLVYCFNLKSKSQSSSAFSMFPN